MGANPYRKDLYVEIGHMDVAAQVDGPDSDSTPDSVSYGGVLRPPHSHRPYLEALKLVGKAFNDAPVINDYGQGKTGPNGIAVHFDVGPTYFDNSCSGANVDCANHYIIGRRTGESPTLARGGESVNEMDTICQRGLQDPPWVCQVLRSLGHRRLRLPGHRGLEDRFPVHRGQGAQHHPYACADQPADTA